MHKLFFIVLIISALVLYENYCSLFFKAYEVRPVYEAIADTKDFDAIIIGTSHSAYGIDVAQLNIPNINFTNLSIPGSKPLYHYGLYKDYIKYHHKPRYVIYSVDWFMFDENHMLRKFVNDLYAVPLKIYFDHLINNLSQFNDYIINRFCMFKIKTNDLTYISKLIANRSKRVPTKLNFENDLKGKLIWGKIYDNQLFYFMKLVDDIKKSGVELIIIQTPEYLPSEYADAFYKNNEFIKYYAGINNIKLFNYNTEKKSNINFTRDYFFSWGHLNSNGRNVFTKILSSDLSAYIASTK